MIWKSKTAIIIEYEMIPQSERIWNFRLRLELFGSSLEFPGGDEVVETGIDNVAAVLARDLPDHAIKLGHEVKKIDYNREDKITVDVYDRERETSYTMDAVHVICTIPIGVLQKSHAKMFSPELPLNKVSE